MNFEIDYLLIAGNGFDMDLGLKTSYKDFFESDEWKHMCDGQKKGKSHPSLIDYIEEKRKNKEGYWYDLEQTMLDYVLPRKDGTFVNNADEDKKDYDTICNTLVEYLCNLFWKEPNIVAQKMMNSYAGDLLYAFFDPLNSGRNILYTFNYTPLEIIYGIVGGWPTTAEYYNIHGGISKDDFFKKKYDGSSIILGIMTDKEIAPGYSFMVKSHHPKYCRSNIEQDLITAHHVCIFGHSLNQIDFGYFEGYFKMLTSYTEKKRDLIIITKNKKTKGELLDNLEKMEISIEDVFEHALVKFAFTDNQKKRKRR